jgi:hypothetical protein
MLRHIFRALALAAGSVTCLSPAVVRGDWEIPTPAKTEHPGAEQAPASSPRTYPDAEGFDARRDKLIQSLVDEDLTKWRRGYFSGGDPAKYSHGAVMAKLLANPKAADAIRLINDNRAFSQHYHFAAVNWGRFYPLFADVLTAETRRKFADKAFRYGSYLSPRGTENHVVMWMTTVNVLPSYIDKGLSHRPKDTTLRRGKQMLANYVKGLYAGGQGEWDSSTYLAFDVNGMLNVYDFAEDPEVRLLAKAALDWYAAAYALKYRDGVYTAPNQRGYAPGPVDKITDHIGWLWWDSDATIGPRDLGQARYAIHAATSGYRPNAVLTRIARKQLPELPFVARNTKPNYWGTKGSPRPGMYPETLYVGKALSMGSVWRGHGSQMTRFQIVVDTDRGGKVFSGGNPRKSDHRSKKTGIGFHDGTGRYSQQAQIENLFVSMSLATEGDDQADYSYFLFPLEARISRKGDWFVFKLGPAHVAVYPLGGKGELTLSPPNKRGRVEPMLKIPGRKSGFVVFALDQGQSVDLLEKTKVDTAGFASNLAVSVEFPAPDGEKQHTLRMQFDPDPDGDAHGNRPAQVWIDGKKTRFEDWDVYQSPYIEQSDGVLGVNDGQTGFIVDFTGDLPVYKPWTK